MKQLNPKEINTTALAYIGDAVYEIYVREYVLGQDLRGMDKNFGAHVDALHKRAIRYVRADGQAKAVKAMPQKSKHITIRLVSRKISTLQV